MSYIAPYIDESGFHYPSYDEILEALIEEMQTIYGSGIYLGNDSKDYQMLSMFADKIHDCFQTAEIVYNSHSPVTAMGTGLDYIVALNGIARKAATRSTVELALTGTAGTVITNGVASDENGNLWDLPEEVTLDANGVATVSAYCEVTGSIEANANTITGIVTPTSGWTDVTNPQAAVTGIAVETDSELRARQADSVAMPAQSTMEALKAAIIAVEDVKRAEVYENYSNQTDSNGIPAHSVCCVVEGGEEEDIAEMIRLNKGLGCGTYGSTSVDVEDSEGRTTTIKYSKVQYVDVDITVNISKKTGFAASTATEISTAIVDYLSDFAIGADLTTSIIWMVAQQVNADYRNPTFAVTSILAARHGQTQSASDVVIGYAEAARGSAANIAVNVT